MKKIDPLLIGEYFLIKRMVTEVYPTGVVSLVSDTFDFFRTLTVIVPKLKQEILNRQPDALGFAKVVFRPDSGDPVKIICGDPYGATEAERKGAIECLWDIFEGKYTLNGFKVLDSHVGVIYGDSITLDRASKILEGLYAKGFASCNIVFGIGSFTYQYVSRDTFGHAYKATFGTVDGEDRVLFKQPKTDTGMKFSARGLLRIDEENGELVLYENQTREQEKFGMLETRFENGNAFGDNLETIRNRLKNS